MTRKQVLSASTQFTCAQFFPTAVQILTTGTDRKISYWEVFDGSLVRHIDGSSKGCINWLDINSSGEMFISGGDDQFIKVGVAIFFLSINKDKGNPISKTHFLFFPRLFCTVVGLSDGNSCQRWHSTRS